MRTIKHCTSLSCQHVWLVVFPLSRVVVVVVVVDVVDINAQAARDSTASDPW